MRIRLLVCSCLLLAGCASRTDPSAPDAPWTRLRVDAAPWIIRAFTLARQNGYLAKTELRDLSVSGLNFGWEMPGTYDAVMQVRSFSLRATPLPSPNMKGER